jgi:MerR family transcriptional regulator, heat shock protein HspR
LDETVFSWHHNTQERSYFDGEEVRREPMQTSGDEPVYVISVAARLADLPSWVLRVLDQEGIVVPGRTDSKRRLYSDNDIVRLARVRQLTEDESKGGLGVNMAGVKAILAMEAEAQERERQWERRLLEMQKTQEELLHELARLQNESGAEVALAHLPPTELLPANGK